MTELPHNIDAEAALLGALLVDNGVYDRVSDIAGPEHFFDPVHGQIFEIAARLIGEGRAATPITLRTFFEAAAPISDTMTIPQYLGSLAANAVTTRNAPDYARTVRDLATRRQLVGLAEDMARINRELVEQTHAYQTFSPNQPSNLMFDKPVDGPLSSPFGLRRFFNGEERNPHSGLDFAVGAGTPIKSPAAGKVILIGNYFFNGNTVFVDHGQGLISMFCHMSKIDVKLGQSLPRGGIVGRVGSTGRATGPHMHWNVSLNDTRVDPAIFIGAFKP